MKLQSDPVQIHLPEGLTQAVLSVLEEHQGRNNAIGRKELVKALAGRGHNYIGKDDRTIRYAINRLRKSGHPIGSCGGRSGGYWLITGPGELQDYLSQELLPRIKDLREQAQAIQKTAAARWPVPSLQMHLPGI